MRAAVAAGQRAASKASVLAEQAAAQGYSGNAVAEAPHGWTEGWVGVEAPEAVAEGHLAVDPDDDAPLIPALVGVPAPETGDALVDDWASFFGDEEDD
jgi:hypothetical protein